MDAPPQHKESLFVSQEELQAVEKRIMKHIETGFPHGDLATHRRVHEGYIEEAEDRRALWRGVREKLLTGGVIAVFGFLGSAIWDAVIKAIRGGA